ncbi:hypothetical protein DFH07DRAFT_768996 [Mycena maculata]|uniref:F-box domain-containing protein n=1 Tax=Mycena maculata TaxID=230809 RepID=A0AAD7JPB7_9AGAR|nr:hypothetical protein DFH07DRAFT_768996 [Mycena maculata]
MSHENDQLALKRHIEAFIALRMIDGLRCIEVIRCQLPVARASNVTYEDEVLATKRALIEMLGHPGPSSHSRAARAGPEVSGVEATTAAFELERDIAMLSYQSNLYLPPFHCSDQASGNKWPEAMRNRGRADTPLLKSWLDHYGAPSTTPALRRPHFHKKKRAELWARVAARKARVDALMELRRRGLEASTRKWPRPRCHKYNKENQRRDAIRIRKERACNKVAMDEREALVLLDVALFNIAAGSYRHIKKHQANESDRGSHRNVTERRQQISHQDGSEVDSLPRLAFLLKIPDARFVYSRMAPRLLLNMQPMAPKLPLDMHWEIVQWCDLPTLLSLTLLSSSFDDLVRPSIYCEIIVSRRAKLLGKHSLTRAGVEPCSAPHAEPAAPRQVPLTREAISRLPFRLVFFGARCTVDGAWANLVASQTSLEVLCFEAEFFSKLPTLPNLATLKARPADVAHFMESHSLLDVWLWSGSPNSGDAGLTMPDIHRLAASPSRLLTMGLGAGQLLTLLNEVPAVLSAMEHIAIDEDDDWWSFGFLLTPTPNRLLLVGAGLDTRFPALKTLMFVSEMNPGDRGFNKGSRLIADIGLRFSSALWPLCTAPRLRTFHFCAYDGCITLKRWGQIDEEFHVADWEEHSENESDRSEHHAAHPLHRIQTWTGHNITPSQLGLHLSVGPDARTQCPHPVQRHNFDVVIERGVVRIDIFFCGYVVRRPPACPAQPIPVLSRVWRRPTPPEDGLKEMREYFRDSTHEEDWQAGVADLETCLVEIHTNGWRGAVVVAKNDGEEAEEWPSRAGGVLSLAQMAALWEPTAVQVEDTKYRLWVDEHLKAGKGKQKADPFWELNKLAPSPGESSVAWIDYEGFDYVV